MSLTQEVPTEQNLTPTEVAQGVRVPAKSSAEARFVGARFGRLIIVEFAGRDKGGHRFWACRCDCRGDNPEAPLVRVRQDFLTSGRTQSCGCRRVELMWQNQRPSKQSRRNGPAQEIEKETYPEENKIVTTEKTPPSEARFRPVRLVARRINILKLRIRQGDRVSHGRDYSL